MQDTGKVFGLFLRIYFISITSHRSLIYSVWNHCSINMSVLNKIKRNLHVTSVPMYDLERKREKNALIIS